MAVLLLFNQHVTVQLSDFESITQLKIVCYTVTHTHTHKSESDVLLQDVVKQVVGTLIKTKLLVRCVLWYDSSKCVCVCVCVL